MQETRSLKTYFDDRLKLVADGGAETAYPNDFRMTCTVPEFRATYDHIENGAVEDVIVKLAGRVENIRHASKKLIFIDVEGDSSVGENHFQILLSKKEYPDVPEEKYLSFGEIKPRINRGDIIGITGCPHRTVRGELSVLGHGLRLLVPCLHDIPRELGDRNLIDSKRYLHFIINKNAKSTIIARSRMIRALRGFLEERDFLELETPMLEFGTGANAAPFKTYYNALDTDVNLRVAPELYLKRACIAGFGRVFEIGRQFRNEGQDPTHNPEFTTCEFYQTYAGLEDLMTTTEELLVTLRDVVPDKLRDTSIDWTPPYRRINIVPAITDAFCKRGIELDDTWIHNEPAELVTLTQKIGLELPSVHTYNKLLDNLIEGLLESQCTTRPVFLYGHPLSMSPLAKPYHDQPHLAQRFELFVMGTELCNAYAELNNPILQRKTLERQAKERAGGDTETIQDDSYCVAMEYGLPPTAGWGMGIDRLVMLMLGIERIGDTMPFQLSRAALTDPSFAPVVDQDQQESAPAAVPE